MDTPYKQIRARYDDETVTVYQAYRPGIALRAVEAQTFVDPFKVERMTWIKPSFLWMMYRCGWAEKEGQEHVLAIDITREGFAWALDHACLSSASKAGVPEAEWSAHKASHPVRVQWDPERDLHLNRLDHRSIQIGLSGPAVPRYVNDWIVRITDVTALARDIRARVVSGDRENAASLLPAESPYPVSDAWRAQLGM